MPVEVLTKIEIRWCVCLCVVSDSLRTPAGHPPAAEYKCEAEQQQTSSPNESID